MQTSLLVEALYAIGIGLVVGLEREHSEVAHGMADGDVPVRVRAKEPPQTGAPPRHTAMGARTCALLSLSGWLLAFLGDREPWLVPIGLVGLIALIGAQMWMGREIGMTTEVAGVIVVLLGALVHRDKALAVALCLGVSLLLVAKPWMIRFVGQLRRIEILATLQLLLMAAILLPLLPVEARDPWGALPPRKVGTFIVLIAGVQYIGYVLTRLLGTTRGTGLAGLVGGLSSSTAVTVSMARQARATPAFVRPGQLATLLANTVMPVRVAIIAGAISPEVGWRIAAAGGAMALVLLVAALVTWRQLRKDPPAETDATIELRNPFQLWGALSWGAILCVVLLAAKGATRYLGQSGFLLAAGVSGLTDVDAITLAAAEQHRALSLTAEVAALAIAIAVCANTVVKGAMAWFGGGRAFGKRIVLVFLIAIVATVGTAAVGLAIG
jgi:uncharacterized membrane protein (DUF4010 family)